MTDEQYSQVATLRNNLEDAVRELVKTAESFGATQEEIVDAIIDVVCDGTDRRVIFSPPLDSGE